MSVRNPVDMSVRCRVLERVPRAGARGAHAGNDFGLVDTKEESSTISEEARNLRELFFIKLVKAKLHLHRKDLPLDSNPKSIKKKNRTLHLWDLAAKDLLDQLDCNVSQVKKVMKWYFLHHRSRFVPHCRSFTTFAEKFFNIEKAMLIEEGEQEPGSQIIIVQK